MNETRFLAFNNKFLGKISETEDSDQIQFLKGISNSPVKEF